MHIKKYNGKLKTALKLNSPTLHILVIHLPRIIARVAGA